MLTYRTGNQNDIQKIAELLIDTWKNCYKGFIPNDYLESLSVDRQIQRHSKYMQSNVKYIVAETEVNGVIGFSSYGDNRIKNINCEKEIYTIYVCINHQGQGVGNNLLNSILSDLNNTKNEIAVSVFEKNPFKQFYVKNGFVKIDEEIIELGQFALTGGIYLKRK